jgi:hypothetical protein
MAKKRFTNNNHLMYLAMLALSLIVVPFLIQAIRGNAVAEYQTSYATTRGR